jgi:hypothetical protein
MARRLWIPELLPGMNDIIEDCKVQRVYRRKDGKKCRIPRYAEVKRAWDKNIDVRCLQQGFTPITEPSHFTFLLFEKNRYRDPDNIGAGARKIILDALQSSGRLKNDGWKNVLGLSEYWVVRKEKPGVVLFVTSPGFMTKEAALLLEEQHERRTGKEAG